MFNSKSIKGGRRLNGESFPAYRKRLKKEQNLTERKLKGRLIWDSDFYGTYSRVRHGPL